MTIDMTNFRGHRTPGRDYSRALRDLLPQIIATSAKSKLEIAAEAQRDHESVSRVIAKLRDQVRIAGWRRGRSGPIEALWLWGAGEDVPYPGPMSSAEKSKRDRSTEHGHQTNLNASRNWRKSEAGKSYEAINNERRKQRYYMRKQIAVRAYHEIKARDPLLAAIMGIKK